MCETERQRTQEIRDSGKYERVKGEEGRRRKRGRREKEELRERGREGGDGIVKGRGRN